GTRTQLSTLAPRHGLVWCVGFAGLLRVGSGEVIIEIVQIASNSRDVTLAQSEPGVALPATNLGLEAGPIGGQCFLTPVDLRCVTANAVRRVEQLAARVCRSAEIARGGYASGNQCESNQRPYAPHWKPLHIWPTKTQRRC